MTVALRQPTFKNPLPAILRGTGKFLVAVLVGIVAFGESAGRARAAAELSRQGYHEEARRLMLRKDEL